MSPEIRSALGEKDADGAVGVSRGESLSSLSRDWGNGLAVGNHVLLQSPGALCIDAVVSPHAVAYGQVWVLTEEAVEGASFAKETAGICCEKHRRSGGMRQFRGDHVL